MTVRYLRDMLTDIDPHTPLSLEIYSGGDGRYHEGPCDEIEIVRELATGRVMRVVLRSREAGD